MDLQKINEFNSIEEILEFAVNEEKEAEEYYLAAADRTPDPQLKEFLVRLAAMEKEHFLMLKAKLEECRANNFTCKGILNSFNFDR